MICSFRSFDDVSRDGRRTGIAATTATVPPGCMPGRYPGDLPEKHEPDGDDTIDPVDAKEALA